MGTHRSIYKKYATHAVIWLCAKCARRNGERAAFPYGAYRYPAPNPGVECLQCGILVQGKDRSSTGLTLSAWSKRAGIPVQTVSSELASDGMARCVIIGQFHHERSMLWGLSDYKVSTVSGMTVWLVPNERNA